MNLLILAQAAAPDGFEGAAKTFIENAPFDWSQAWLFLMCTVIAITVVQLRKKYFLGELKDTKDLAVREFRVLKKIVEGKKRPNKTEKADLLALEKAALHAKRAYDRAIGMAIIVWSMPITGASGPLLGLLFWSKTFEVLPDIGFGLLAAGLQKWTFEFVLEPGIELYYRWRGKGKPKERSGKRDKFDTAGPTSLHDAMKDEDE